MTSHQLPASTDEAQEVRGVSATGLDAERKVVHLDDGSGLPYDAVVIATGSRARRLGTGQTGGNAGRCDGELTLRNLEDALTLRRRLTNRPSVVVIGGGALGMEIASGCLSVGCEVTLVAHDRPLTRQLGPYLSDVFLCRCPPPRAQASAVPRGRTAQYRWAHGRRASAGCPRGRFNHRSRTRGQCRRRCPQRRVARLQRPTDQRPARSRRPRARPSRHHRRRRCGRVPDQARHPARSPVDQRHRAEQGRGPGPRAG